LLWAPTGWRVGFIVDGWNAFLSIEQSSIDRYIVASRPFTHVPWYIAYWLSPGQFVGTNILTAFLIFAKGWLCFQIMHQLTEKNVLFSYMVAVLVVLFPADSGIFYLGALGIHWALFCFLFSVHLFILYRKKRRLSLLIAAWLMQMLTVGVYEISYVFIAFIPFVLIVFAGSLFSRQRLRWITLWYIVPFISGIWYLFLLVFDSGAVGYQLSLINAAPSQSSMLTDIFRIYRIHLWDGWNIENVALNTTHVLFALAAGGVVFFTSYQLGLRDKEQPLSHKQLIQLGLVGIITIFLGVLLYLPTSERVSTLRTFYYSSIGAGLLITVVAWAASRIAGVYRFIVVAILVGSLASVATYRLLDQHRQYWQKSEDQQSLITEMAQVMGRLEPDTHIVVLDVSANSTIRTLFNSMFFDIVTRLIYQDSTLSAALCLSVELRNACSFTQDSFVETAAGKRPLSSPLNTLIVLEYDVSFQVVDDLTRYGLSDPVGYEPYARMDPNGPIPPRIATMFP